MENVKIGGSLARNARFFAPTCLVSSLWLSCGVAVSMGEAGKPYLFECFQAGCHTLHTLHFTLLTPHSTLYTRHSLALFTPHSILYTLHFPFHAPDFTLRTSHSTLSTPRSTLHTLHSTLYTLGWWSRYSCGASCHVLLTWLREISALLSFKILINIQRCRCPKRWIELVSRVY